MSRENVELVVGVLEAYRNPGAMQMVADDELDLGWVDPEIERGRHSSALESVGLA